MRRLALSSSRRHHRRCHGRGRPPPLRQSSPSPQHFVIPPFVRCFSTNNNPIIEVTQTSRHRNRHRRLPQDGLTLGDFVQGTTATTTTTTPPPHHDNNHHKDNNNDTTTSSSWMTHYPTTTKDDEENNNPQQTPITFHIKTYGCQMNVNDSDIVRSLLTQAHFQETSKEEDATVLLTNTCAIREGAETKVWHRLKHLQGRYPKSFHNKKKKNNKKHTTLSSQPPPQKKIIGVLGCMAERLKENLFKDGLADLVVGPDAYRDLPHLVHSLLRPTTVVEDDHQEDDTEDTTHPPPPTTAVNVQLSLEETYADVTPIRHNPQDVSAFVSVMRGCNNMCSYCVVPFTRGRERSRPFQSIVDEVHYLIHEEHVKEIVLLGQNVNSYHDKSDMALPTQKPLVREGEGVQEVSSPHHLPPTSTRSTRSTTTTRMYQTSNEGFTNLYKLRGGAGYYFCDLVDAVSAVSPEVRVRFTSPHPKDYPPELLSLMAERPNVCNQLHMPAQSGSSSVLSRMRRGYTRDAYLTLIDDVRSTIPDVALSSDFIAGFCDETIQEHQDTLSLMEQVQYDQAYMFAYSMRGKTHAHRKMTDNVPEEIKKQRLQEVIQTFRTHVQRRNEHMELGRLRLVLVEGESRKSTPTHRTLGGRTDQNKRILFPFPQDTTTLQHPTTTTTTTTPSLWTDDMVRPLLSQLQNGTSHQDVLTNYYLQQQSSTTTTTTPSPALSPPPPSSSSSSTLLQPGDYAVVEVTEVRGHTLRGRALWKTSLSSFADMGLFNVDDTALRHASNLRQVLHHILPPPPETRSSSSPPPQTNSTQDSL